MVFRDMGGGNILRVLSTSPLASMGLASNASAWEQSLNAASGAGTSQSFMQQQGITSPTQVSAAEQSMQQQGYNTPQTWSNTSNSYQAGGISSTAGSASAINAGSIASIPADQITPTAPIDIQDVTFNAALADGTVAGAESAAKSLLKGTTTTEAKTATQLKDEALMKELEKLYGQDVGEAAMMQAELKQRGIDELNAKKAEFESNILAGLAEYEQLKAQYQATEVVNRGKAIPMSKIIGNQAQIDYARQSALNMKASDIKLQQALALGAQGKIDSAIAMAQQAVDLKYKAIEEEITAKERQRKLLEPQLNREEADRLRRLQMKDQLTMDLIKEKKAQAKSNIATALEFGAQTEYVNLGGNFFRRVDGQQFSSPEEFFAASGVKSFQEAYAKGLVTDITQSKIDDKNFVKQLRSKYYDAGIVVTDTPEQAVQKLQNSLLYRKDTFNKEVFGEDTTTPIVKEINGKTMQFNPSTGQWETPSTTTGGAGGTEFLSRTDSVVEKISSLRSILTHKQLDAAVGPTKINRVTINPAGRAEFLGRVDQLISKESLDSLIAAKAKGATFGALSDQELRVLGNAATALGGWAIRNDKGKLVGFKVGEKQFKDEVNRMINAASKVMTYAIKEQYENMGFDIPYEQAVKKAGSEERLRQILGNEQRFSSVGGDTNKAVSLQSVPIGGKNIQVDSSIANKLAQAAAEFKRVTGQTLQVNQSYRTRQQQAELYKKLSSTGARVAPPGKSFHELGLAIDVTNWKAAEAILRKYGFRNDLADDKGHFSIGEFS